MDINSWLTGLGLERYTEAFREHDVDGDTLYLLAADDLKEIGVASVGPRRRLLDAIAWPARVQGAFEPGAGGHWSLKFVVATGSV